MSGTPSDLVTWPRDLSGTALATLQAVYASEEPTNTPTPGGPGATNTPTPTPTLTPTVTPTPRYMTEIPLASGNTVLLERKFSYGEIAVALAVGGTAVVSAIKFMIQWSGKWLR